MADVPEEVRRLVEAIEALEAMEDDAACTTAVSEALRNWPSYHARLRALREKRVLALREQQKKTWPEIAEIIGEITPERAQQISKGLRGTKRPKKTDERDKS